MVVPVELARIHWYSVGSYLLVLVMVMLSPLNRMVLSTSKLATGATLRTVISTLELAERPSGAVTVSVAVFTPAVL